MFDRAKIIAEGGTYHDEANPLIECASFKATKIMWSPVAESGLAPSNIKEDANLPKRMMIEGVFQRAGVRNANEREYPFKLWERLLLPGGAVQTRINEKAMIGHLEHPETGATDLNRGAIRIEKAWMLEDGTIMGRAMVFNTPEGQRIQEYVTTGTKIGISSRGTGTVDAKGVVCEDFSLETWDMVYNPSTPGAHPELATESEQPVHDSEPTLTERKIETSAGSDTTRTQDVTMSLSKRIAEARASAQQYLAVDPKRLDEAGRDKLAADILDARVKLAQAFIGEERVAEVEKILKSLDEAKTTCEDFDGGMVAGSNGDVQTGLPGGAFDALNKTVAGLAGDVKVKAVESIKSLADLIAANMGKLPHIQAAVEAEIAGTKPQVVEAAKHEELKKLLGEARDEIITRTKREEAALALMAESAAKLKALQGKVTVVEAENAKAIATIAELTAAGGKKDEKTNESKVTKTEDKKVDESTVAKPKSLHERIADKVKSASSKPDAALPLPGQKTESAKDAGDAAAKGALHEEVTKPTKRSGADLLAVPMKRIAEDLGKR